MATYVNDLRLKEIATGDESGTWGTSTNTNLELIAEAFSFGTEAITTNADTHTTTIADGSTDPGRSLFLKYTGTLDSTCTITIGPNTVSKLWFIENATSGSQSIIIKQGSGATITIANGQTKAIYSDGAGSGGAMVDALQDLSVPDLFIDDDLTFTSDSAVITFGADGDTTLTHTDGSGLTLNSTNKIMFNDASQFIQGSSATVLALGATDEIDLTATAIDVNGTMDVSGAITSSAGATITVADNTDNLSLISTDTDDNSGPNLRMYRFSANPADADVIGQIDFEGRNDNTQDVRYGFISAKITDASDGTENGQIRFFTIADGTETQTMTLESGRVGIGTSSPSFPLTVQADSNADGLVIIGRSSDDIGELGFYENDGSTNLGEIQYRQDHVNFRHRVGGIRFATGGTTERMRITSAGNVGIGTTSPQAAKFSGSAAGILELANTKPVINIHETDVTDAEFFMGMSGGSAVIGTTGSGLMIFQTGTSSASERMRIDSSGNLLVGATSAPSSRKFYVESQTYPCQLRMGTSAVNYPVLQLRSGYVTGSQTGTQIDFRDGADNSVGTITSTVSATAYNTSSDQRLKKNIADADDAGSKVDAIQVRKFDWITDGSHQDYGMVAQELQGVAPEAVSGDADSYEMMGVDYSKLVPMLIKEIQSLRARVNALES